MAKIILHGILDVFGEPLDISANTANDALIAIITHLKRTNQELFKDQLFLQVKGYDTLEALKAPLESDAQLHIMPAFNAGKKGGLFLVLFGAVLFLTGHFQLIGFLGEKVSGYLAAAGVGLFLGGLVQIISPTPQLDTQPEETNPEASKYISGIRNTTKIGTRITLAYGTFPIPGHFLSINVQSTDVSHLRR